MNASRILAVLIVLAGRVHLLAQPTDLEEAAQLRAYAIDLTVDAQEVRTNIITATVRTGEPRPQEIAVIVERRDTLAGAPQISWEQAPWRPFATTLAIDLGPGEGRRVVWILGHWTAGSTNIFRGDATRLKVDYTAPLIIITNPVEQMISGPMLQLQGYSDEPLQSIRYDLLNGALPVRDGQGLVNHQTLDPRLIEFTTNYFTCYDLDLAPGTNVIVLRCQDLAGNTSTNTLTYIFSTENDHTPPLIALQWPLNGTRISADTFTARGRLDDPTASTLALIVANGSTNTAKGVVEREGQFWFEDLPLAPGLNSLTVAATDAAGNTAQTNLVVFRDDITISMDPVVPPEQLWQREVTVTGKVAPANSGVLVNGIKAQVGPNGNWVARAVPVVSPTMGTAVFDLTAVPGPGAAVRSASGTGSNPPSKFTSVLGNLADQPITLNANQPACGSFALHLTGTAGKSFVLLASTNLVDWVPLTTNRNSQATFDFTDAEVPKHTCRFFRVELLR